MRTGLMPSRSARGVAAIASGTALGQLAGVLAAPLLSRFFLPSQFGVFTIVSAVAMILAPAMALRYEQAVPLPADDDDARGLVALGFAVSLATLVLLTAVALLVSEPLARAFGTPSSAPWLCVAPLLAATLAWFTLLNQWALRLQRYAATGRRNVIQGISTVVLQVVAGAAGAGGGGLVAGYAGGQLLGALALLPGSRLAGAGRDRMRRMAYRYRRFPLFLAPAGVINVAGIYLPPLLVAALFGTEAAGWLGFTQRILALPLTLIGQAVAQVYLSELAKTRRDATAREQRLFSMATRRLAVVGGAGALFLLATGPELFRVVFGANWVTSGELAQALAISLAAQFVASPLSQTLIVFERTGTQLTWDVSRLAAVTAAVLVPWSLGFGLVPCVWSLSLVSAAMYGVSWWLSRRALRAGVSAD